MINKKKPLCSITFTVLCAVTILVLFTTATGARIVPAYFLFVPNGLRALYLAGVFHRGTTTSSHKFWFRCFHTCFLPGFRSCLAHILGLLLRDLSFEQEAYNVFVHLYQHIAEQIEGFHFIDNNGVLLL